MPIIAPRLRLRASRPGRSAFAPAGATRDRLSDLPHIDDNPGRLRGRYYAPAGLQRPAALVVVLHGCTQNAAVYDHGSGWTTLADRHDFLLLFPEQQRANNSMLCFNWFAPENTGRGRGEAASIRSMIDALGKIHEVDEARIFVTGLSAGGAMSSVMLATYPEMFAAGAILAGVAYGCAASTSEAFGCMGGRGRNEARDLGRKVRLASAHEGPWPRVQVWQGSADTTVVPSNGEAIVQQWRDVHGLDAAPDRTDSVAGFPRRVWLGADGRPAIEHFAVTGMAHGIPVASGGDEAIGNAGPHMLDVGLSSTSHIAAFFGLATEAQAKSSVVPAGDAALPRGAGGPPSAGGVQEVIEKALRAAGLMR